MTRLIIGMISMLSVSAMALSSFPDGVYKGKGNWRGQDGKTKGSYTAVLKIKKNHIMGIYSEGKKTETYKSVVKFEKGDFFKLLDPKTKEVTGDGYCGSIWCHWNFTDKKTGMKGEETIVFEKKMVYRLGSMMMNGKRMAWEDRLKKVGPKKLPKH